MPAAQNRVREVFDAALDLPAAQVDTFLDSACGTDIDLRRRVAALLAAHARPDPVLDRPAAEALSGVPELVPHSDGPPVAPPGYTLAEEVGRGGMGVVYRATHTALGRDVAVKLLQGRYPAGSSVAARFLDEARITARLQHPGVPPVHEVGQLPDGRPFLAMKLVEGDTLDELLKRRPDSSHDRGRFVAVFEGVCQAVGYAHSKGVIHRDLKPENVMVGAFGEVQVMDWGLAKQVRNSEVGSWNEDGEARYESATPHSALRTPHSTRVGSVMGTPGFMAPEQARGELHRVDRRADVFGLGAILCVILTGKPPFAGPDWTTTLGRNAAGDLADARTALANCGAEPDLIALCEQCLALEPDDRPTDAGAVAARVGELRTQAADRARRAEVEAAAADARATGERRRRRALLWVGGGLVAVLLLGVAGTTAGLIWADAARQTAETAERETEAKRVHVDVARGKAEAKEAEAVAAAGDTKAFSQFLVNNVLAAGRPAGLQGGLGKDVTMIDALRAAEQRLDEVFAGRPKAEATARHALGVTWRTLARNDDAERHLRRAVELRKRELGPLAPDTLDSLNSLAVVCEQRGRVAEAEALMKESLAGHRQTLGPAAVETLNVAVNLGFLYIPRGRYDDALRVLEEAEAEAVKALGREHPVTLAAVANQGIAHAYAGRDEIAEGRLAEALAGHRKAHGDKHPITIFTMRELANVYRKLNRAADAGKLFTEALAAAREVLGERHPETLMLRTKFAVLRTAEGRYDDAEKLLAEGLPPSREAFGPDHPHTLETLHAFGTLRDLQQRPADAVRFLEEALAGFRNRYGAKQFMTANTARQLGVLYRGLKKPAEAADRLKLALDGSADAQREFCQSNLGLALVEAGKPTEAEPHLTAAYQTLSKRNDLADPEKERLRAVLGALADVCASARRKAEADEWRTKLAAVK